MIRGDDALDGDWLEKDRKREEEYLQHGHFRALFEEFGGTCFVGNIGQDGGDRSSTVSAEHLRRAGVRVSRRWQGR